MSRLARGYIDPTEAVYLQLVLGGADARRKKIALQTFSKLSRAGLRLRNPQPMLLTIRGLLYDSDLKVVRWALNALAFVAGLENVGPILDAIGRYRHNPDILAAGIAALAATIHEDDLRARLAGLDLPLEGAVLLAAAQKLPSLKSDLQRLRINIDTASVGDLRLCCVLIGIDKAPEHLFSLDHDNSAVIGELNNHPDPMAAQYSIWALTENRSLGFANLRISLADTASQRANIRSYIYRLIAEDQPTARRNHDFLVSASEDDDDEARESLARGLVGTYYDGLDELMTSWVIEETNIPVRDYVLDHMAAQATRAPAYEKYVIQTWEHLPVSSTGRARLETIARGTKLGTELRRKSFLESSAEFLPFGAGPMTNTTFNITNMQGAVSGSGNATAGDISAVNQIEAPAKASELLQKIDALMVGEAGMHLPEGGAIVAAAATAPSKTTVQRALEWLKLAKESGSMASASVTALPALMHQLHALAPLLPG